MSFMAILSIIIGLVLLLSGRKLYWFFIGAAGFILGLVIVGQFFKDQPLWLQIVISLGGGLLGIVLALLLQKFALTVAGFLAGGYGLVALLNIWDWFSKSKLQWIPFIIGGIIGAILIIKLFQLGLILLSSFGGAGMIVQAIGVKGITGVVIFIALLILGIFVQWKSYKPEVKAVVAE